MSQMIKKILPLLDYCKNYEYLLKLKSLFDMSPDQILILDGYYELNKDKLDTLIRLCDDESDFIFFKAIIHKSNKVLILNVISTRNWNKSMRAKMEYLETENQSLKKENQQLIQDNINLMKDVRDLGELEVNLNDKCSKLEEENKDLKHRLKKTNIRPIGPIQLIRPSVLMPIGKFI